MQETSTGVENTLRKEARDFLARRHKELTHDDLIIVLKRLLGEAVEPADIEKKDMRWRICRKLSFAIKRQAGLARSGSRRYDLNRHISLRNALNLLVEMQ